MRRTERYWYFSMGVFFISRIPRPFSNCQFWPHLRSATISTYSASSGSRRCQCQAGQDRMSSGTSWPRSCWQCHSHSCDASQNTAKQKIDSESLTAKGACDEWQGCGERAVSLRWEGAECWSHWDRRLREEPCRGDMGSKVALKLLIVLAMLCDCSLMLEVSGEIEMCD